MTCLSLIRASVRLLRHFPPRLRWAPGSHGVWWEGDEPIWKRTGSKPTALRSPKRAGTSGKWLSGRRGGGQRCQQPGWGVRAGRWLAMPKKAEKPLGALRRRQRCCKPASLALLQPLPATTRCLNMNILRAGNFPGAVNMLPISYKYFCCCPLATGGLSVCSLQTAGRVWQGSGSVWPVGWGPAAGKTFAAAFPSLLHEAVSFQTSSFLVCYAGVPKLLMFRACCRC